VILHTLALLKELNFRDYATLTVVINGDEEISSPGARNSHQSPRRRARIRVFVRADAGQPDDIALATSGIGARA